MRDLDLIPSQKRLIIRRSCIFSAVGFRQSLLSPVAHRAGATDVVLANGLSLEKYLKSLFGDIIDINAIVRQ